MSKNTCASCGGNGECRDCKGHGYKIGTFGGKSDCSKCNRSGRCKICGGTGKV